MSDPYADIATPTGAGAGPIASLHRPGSGITVEVGGAAPGGDPYAGISAPNAPRQTSQVLGFMEGLVKPLSRIPANPLNYIPGLDARPAEAKSLADVKQYFAGREQTQKPGAAGQFLGNVAGTAMVPGGPVVGGAITGGLLSEHRDPAGIAGDVALGAVGGKLGSSVVGGVGKALSGVTDPAVQYLVSKGVPLTLGQLSGGMVRGAEDRLAGLPVVGDVIRNAQRRGLTETARAAYNDTLSHIGQQLPEDINVGRHAYTHTKQAISDAYDSVLQPLTLQKDAAWNAALTAARKVKIGDPAIKANINQILKTEVTSRFDKAGQMTGEQMKAAQEALGQHIRDLSQGTKWSRDGADVLKGVKGSLEDLVSRTDAGAGEALSAVNRAYAHLKPIETAAAKTSAKDGIFTLAGFNQGVAKGKSASTLAAGNAPHQTLANAATKVLPSTVPDSGTAGRLLITALLGGGLGHSNPVTAPITAPAVAGLLGSAALYSEVGQKLLTGLLTARPAAARAVGNNVRLLARPAGQAGAVALSGSRH